MAAPRSALSAALASYGRPRPGRGGFQGRSPRSSLSGAKGSSGYRADYPAAGRQLGASASGRVNPGRRETEIWRNAGG